MSRWDGSRGKGGATGSLRARRPRTIRMCSVDARNRAHRPHRPAVCIKVIKESEMGLVKGCARQTCAVAITGPSAS